MEPFPCGRAASGGTVIANGVAAAEAFLQNWDWNTFPRVPGRADGSALGRVGK
jgi:hypothetical protein